MLDDKSTNKQYAVYAILDDKNRNSTRLVLFRDSNRFDGLRPIENKMVSSSCFRCSY